MNGSRWFGVVGVAGFAWALAPPSKTVTYTDVQPILSAHCVSCHGQKDPAANLDLSSLAGTIRSVTPGQSAKSVLMTRLRGSGGKPQMPLGFAALRPADIDLIRKWIDQGCVAGGKPSVKHWAYVPPKRASLPAVSRPNWCRNPIDRFVLSRLDAERLTPSPEADKTTLIRRVTLDLTGLPPSPAEVDAFVADRSSDAYEKVVDRLLSSPHYGERMALPWLDAARYADSNGFQMDGDTYQYVWRDWVVRALNTNMPFDRFTTLQLAGDLLPEANESTLKGRAALIATGFNRNHMLNGEGGAIPEEARTVALFDRVDTTSTTWLGLTMACARCHDHKYDPLSQGDYYGMMAYFNNVPESGVPEGGVPYSIAQPWIYAMSADQMAEVKKLEAAVSAAGDPKGEPAKAAQKALDDYRTGIPRVMIMRDTQPRETHIFSRGNYEQPLAKVGATTPAILTRLQNAKPQTRLDLAKWMVSDSNPLTARVQVNRYWQLFFGKGLVRTPENFGVQGERPTHPELLDWLAVEFRESGWDVKRLHRLIVTSATYRQSSKTSKLLAKRDPENRFMARGARFRLPSMLLRDEALAASGLINLQIGGKPVYPYQPKGIWDGLDITDERDFSYPQSKGRDLYRRSLYTFWRRTVAPGNMFDAASRQTCTIRQSLTSTPLHALTTLNDITWVEAGRALAERVMKSANAPEARLAEAFRRVCARRPNPDEMKVLLRCLNRSREGFLADPKSVEAFLSQGDSARDTSLNPVEEAAYASTCLAILNLDEALTRE